MQYPAREAEILRLANDIAAGLATHSDVFPASPFSPQDFQSALGEHDGNREAERPWPQPRGPHLPAHVPGIVGNQREKSLALLSQQR